MVNDISVPESQNRTSFFFFIKYEDLMHFLMLHFVVHFFAYINRIKYINNYGLRTIVRSKNYGPSPIISIKIHHANKKS